MAIHVQRRAFLGALGGAAAAWPLAARAQQREQMRRVAVLLGGLEFDDASGEAEVAALEVGLKNLGWTRGRNIDLDYHWPGADIVRVRTVAAGIVAARPDLVLSRSTPATAAVMHAGLPIVFVLVTDPLGAGFVQNLGRPGGNVTGFSTFESSVGGKWLALLKEAAPEVSRVAMLFNPETAPFAEGYFRSAQAAAQTLGAIVISAPCRSGADIQGVFAARAREGSGGIIGIADTFVADHRDLIVALAVQHRLPAIYGSPIFARTGGLLVYSPDYVEIYRRGAGYVDRILKGGKPGDLPVQAPTRYELVVNLKTAKALGLDVPPMLLARADEVIE
jgi:putative tryptophan/tyrosine transport system substrate-binding protein